MQCALKKNMQPQMSHDLQPSAKVNLKMGKCYNQGMCAKPQH